MKNRLDNPGLKIQFCCNILPIWASKLGKSILPWNAANNKKCSNCLKNSKLLTDNGIPLPSQRCSECGFEII